MIIALAFVVGMLVVVVAGLAWIVRDLRSRVLTNATVVGSEIGLMREAVDALRESTTALKADHEKLVRSLRNQRGIVDGG